MKNMLKLLLILLLGMLILTSCGQHKVDDPVEEGSGIAETEPECVIGDSWYGVVYEDTFYYTTNRGIIRFIDLSDPNAGSFPLNSDVLSGGETNDAGFTGGGFFAVSPKLTRENDGNHVLIFAQGYRDGKMAEKSFRLMAYNTKTNSVSKIADGIDRMMQSLLLYDDTIVYTVNNEKNGWDIYRVGVDGDDHIKKDNPKKANYIVVTVYGDRIYYVNEKSGMLYSSSLMLDDEREHFRVNAVQILPFVADGYIYYASTKINYTLLEDRKYAGFDIYRRSLEELSEEELFLENVSGGWFRGGKLFFSYNEPRRVTETRADNFTVLNEFSFDTGKTNEIYDLSGTTKTRSWIAMTEKYVIFNEIDYSTGDTVESRTKAMIVHNLATGEETVLPVEE